MLSLICCFSLTTLTHSAALHSFTHHLPPRVLAPARPDCELLLPLIQTLCRRRDPRLVCLPQRGAGAA